MSFQSRPFNIYLDYQARMFLGQVKHFIRQFQQSHSQDRWHFVTDRSEAEVLISMQANSENRLSVRIENNSGHFYFLSLNFHSLPTRISVRRIGKTKEYSEKDLIEKIFFLAAKRIGALMN